MRTFLLKEKIPVCKWGLIPENTLYQGLIPDNYDLAVNPHQPYIIVDVDRHGKKDGFLNIPEHLKAEMNATLHYPTKNNGQHSWFEYSGDKVLINKASNLGIDLRIGNKKFNEKEWTHGGYVKWHPRNTMKIEDVLHLANKTSKDMNNWLESLFSHRPK